MKDYFLATAVMARRMPILVQEAQRLAQGQVAATGRAESERMVTEKIEALNEGFLHAAVEAVTLNFELGFMAMTGNAAGFMRLAQAGPNRISVAATAPAGKRMRSNARRLGRG